MANQVDLGGTKGAYRLIDIREIDLESLLRSGRPADCVLAILAGGGDKRVRAIVGRLRELRRLGRERALAQLLILSGLHGLA